MSSITSSKVMLYTLGIIIIIGIIGLATIPVAGFVGIIIGLIILFATRRALRGL